MLETLEKIPTIDVRRIEQISEELKAEGREEDAFAVATLLSLVTRADEFYTSEEVARKFHATEEIIVALVRKGALKGVIVGERALLPRAQFAEFDQVEHLARELDELLAQYTQEEIEEMIKEARREWQHRKLF